MLLVSEVQPHDASDDDDAPPTGDVADLTFEDTLSGLQLKH